MFKQKEIVANNNQGAHEKTHINYVFFCVARQILSNELDGHNT
jgi:hypothetical protein